MLAVRALLLSAALFVVAPLAAWLALAFGPDPVALQAAQPLRELERDYEGSASCEACHPAQHASWARTFHATMTQLPRGAAVLGNFDGQPVAFYGRNATPFERDGEFWMRLPDASGEREARVALCVGSNRYQQYFELAGAALGDTYVRLPLLWHVGEQRWMHLNGVFLEPDNPDWSVHASSWNDNCVFCHNTAPVPRLALSSEAVPSKSFDTTVAELGIACEACHGPGERHVARMASPVERYRAHLDDAPSSDIVHPAKVGQMESLAVCGQCHSQRLPEPLERITEFLEQGASFRPGSALAGHVQPITRDTPPIDAHNGRIFSDRFWRDGSARLSAYEYLGVTQSPCMQSSAFTCGSCHVMHSGDVHGNIEPDKRGDAACTQCHEDIARDPRAHTHHDPARSGSRCLECHMPRMVYGILDIHRSHRIEVPDPKRDIEAGRPNACTSCHLDRGAAWAAESMRAWWGERYAAPSSRPDGAPLELVDSIASLHSGDAVLRAVYAKQLGRADAALGARQKAFAVSNLIVALGDGYPSIRGIARRSLRALDAELGLGLAAELEGFDVFSSVDERRTRLLALLKRAQQALRSRSDAARPETLLDANLALDLARVTQLLNLQSDHVISIGE